MAWLPFQNGLHKKDLERQKGKKVKTTELKDDKNEVWNMGWKNGGGEENIMVKKSI